ncbi:ORF117 [Agrotis segetum granulovirus]|uniref:ORF117 n=1 Tax=Agrotis segetum granulosis virus TaxID=10464 RepID=Q6QXH7_GVAS|nr:ORF117 [Agrotis segetum granulovirus]
MICKSIILIMFLSKTYGAFPPETFLGTKNGLMQAKAQTYEVILKIDKQYVSHVPKKSGNRLYLSTTSFSPLIMYVIKDGYVFRNAKYNDILCYMEYNGFRMLSFPKDRYMPQSCIFYMEIISGGEEKKELEYKLNKEKELCILSSDITAYNQQKLYVKINNVKRYLTIDEKGMKNEKDGSIFSFSYTDCLTSVEERNYNFICRILRRGGQYCAEGDRFVADHFRWKKELIDNLAETSFTDTTTTFYEDNSTSTTVFSVDAHQTPSSTYFWCDYVDMFCSNSSVRVTNTKTLLIILIFILFN